MLYIILIIAKPKQSVTPWAIDTVHTLLEIYSPKSAVSVSTILRLAVKPWRVYNVQPDLVLGQYTNNTRAPI